MRSKLLFTFFLLPVILSAQTAPVTKIPRQIDIVVAMDLSGSTNGLLDNFRDKFWDVINQCSMLEPRPVIRFGIVGFSRPSFQGSGLTKIICDLTDDYDLLTSELYKVKASVENGYQFVGFALHTAVYDMNWSENPNTIKIIFLIGNGKVNLGAYDFRKAYDEAKQNNITVNTAYCLRMTKNDLQNELPGWNEIADQTGGVSYNIMVNKRTPLVPFNGDMEKTIRLAEDFNATFLPYGKNSKDHFKNMQEIDQNVLNTYDGYFLSRLYYRITDHYIKHQQAWDATSKFSFGKKITNDDLSYILKTSPDSLAPGTKELEQLINQNLKDREDIKQEIESIFPVERMQKISEAFKQEQFGYDLMLDRVIINAVFGAALAKGFSLN